MNEQLASYLARIGLAGPISATAEGLEQVQRAHRQSIGFENLDVLLGRGVALEPEAIRAKLIHGGRGGYCFEQNSLLGDMLALMGLPSRPLLARVWLRVPEGFVPPRTHTFRLVTIGEELWLGDAGFGSSYVPPLPLVDGATAQTADGFTHRLRRAAPVGSVTGEWLVERLRHGASDWEAQYSFDLTEVADLDLTMSNYWTYTRPESRFTKACIVSIVQAQGFASLLDREFTEQTATARNTRTLASPGEWRALLADVFHIALTDAEMAELTPRLFG